MISTSRPVSMRRGPGTIRREHPPPQAWASLAATRWLLHASPVRPLGPALVAVAATLAPATARAAPATPPRVDGPYVGATAFGTLGFTRVRDLDTPGPFGGFGGTARVGDAVLPWMTIGLQLLGGLGYGDSPEGAGQRVGQAAFGGELGFLPLRKHPLSIRVGFAIGGGAVREDGTSGRSGFGGAVFTGSVRYEFFPGAAVRRPNRGGGFGLGPELGWIGATPADRGGPMANTIYTGLAMTFYFGS